ncbi:MAG: alpha-ketoacid dehydrogenase subunit beta [Deltaproteobacteria bacterium]|nr:alpha-ketoacid dehydrogenase subunit beta [Deltaproteobacteria bacterium]
MEEITLGKALNDALMHCMEEDERVLVMGEDVVTGIFPTTKGLVEKFGKDRVINTPLSEAGFSGMGVGASVLGMRPVIEIMLMDFSTVAMDMIANQAPKQHYMSGGQLNCPVVIRTVTGGGRRVGALHSQNLCAWFMHAPGLKVIIPSTPYDAKGLLISAVRDPNPVLFVEHRLLYGIKGPVPKEPYSIPMGEADIKREGEDVTLVSSGRMVHLALEAAEKLALRGIDAEVIDLRTLDPLDEETIVESVKKTGRLVTLDEGYERAGVGSEIVAVVMRQISALKAPVQTIAAPNAPVPVSPALEDLYYPNVDSIMKRIESMLDTGA